MKKLKKLLLVFLMIALSACTKETIDESTLGFLNESMYTNPYFELNIKLGPSWEVNTDKIFDEATISSTDMYAKKDGGFSTIYIVVKKLKEIEDEFDLINRYKKDIEKMIKDDAEILDMNIGSEVLGNKEHPYLYTESLCHYDDKTVNVYEKQFIIKNDEYIAIITLSTFHDDDTERLVALFM